MAWWREVLEAYQYIYIYKTSFLVSIGRRTDFFSLRVTKKSVRRLIQAKCAHVLTEQRMWGCLWRKYAKKDGVLGVFSRRECWQPLGERILLLLVYFGLQTVMFRMCSAQTVMGAAPPPWQLPYGFALLLIIAQQKEKEVKRGMALNTQTTTAFSKAVARSYKLLYCIFSLLI